MVCKICVHSLIISLHEARFNPLTVSSVDDILHLTVKKQFFNIGFTLPLMQSFVPVISGYYPAFL